MKPRDILESIKVLFIAAIFVSIPFLAGIFVGIGVVDDTVVIAFRESGINKVIFEVDLDNETAAFTLMEKIGIYYCPLLITNTTAVYVASFNEAIIANEPCLNSTERASEGG